MKRSMTAGAALLVAAVTGAAAEPATPDGAKSIAAVQQRLDKQFAKLDADGDGAISRAEFTARVERLRGLDANGDGMVTRAERPRRDGRKSRHRRREAGE